MNRSSVDWGRNNEECLLLVALMIFYGVNVTATPLFLPLL